MTAALYAAREGLSVLVVERGRRRRAGRDHRAAGQLPGLPRGRERRGAGGPAARPGGALRRRGAARAGGDRRSATDGAYRLVTTGDGTTYTAFAVLLALGSTYRRLGIEGEEDLIGAGVHFCATCDGAFYRGKRVLVIGGGNSAGEESVFLTRFAEHVTDRHPRRRADGQRGRRAEARRDRRRSTWSPGATPTGFVTDDGRSADRAAGRARRARARTCRATARSSSSG